MSYKPTQPDSRMSSTVLFERGSDFFQHGDYLAARRDFQKILASAPSPELERKSREMLKRTGVDFIEVAVGLAVLALLVFLYVYFGLHE